MADRRMPTQRRGQNTQTAVLEGAARVFDSVGYAGASLSMIGEESGISQGSMYFHFKSKEQIARAVIHEQHARNLPLITNPSEADPLLHLMSVSRGMVDQLQTDPVVRAGMRLVLEESSLGDHAPNFYRDWFEATAKVLEAAVTSGKLVSEIPIKQLSETVISCFTGVQMTSQVISGRTDLVERIRVLWATLIPALVPAERRREAYEGLGRAFATEPMQVAAV